MGNLIYYLLLGSAVQWAGSAATALIIGLLPVVVTVIGTRTAGAVQLRRLAAPCVLCVLCVMGVALVALDTVQDDSGQQASERASGHLTHIAGLLCAAGALVSWSAYSIANARWLRRRPDLSGGDWSLLTSVVTGALALLLAPAALIGSAAHAPLAWAGFWGVSLMLGILASVIGNALWNRASRVLPLTLVGQMIVFETVFALLYGFAWEMRLPTPLELAAIACLLVGVLWCAALHAEAIMMSAADAHAPLPCRLHPAGTPPCASPRRHSPPRPRALRSAALSLSIGLVACSPPPSSPRRRRHLPKRYVQWLQNRPRTSRPPTFAPTVCSN